MSCTLCGGKAPSWVPHVRGSAPPRVDEQTAAHTGTNLVNALQQRTMKIMCPVLDPDLKRMPLCPLFVLHREYQAFRVSADGELHGIGLLIANELSTTGHLRVLAPIRGGPADRAGILPGDEVIQINGEDTKGWTGDKAAKVLRGEGGTEVSWKGLLCARTR